MVLPALSLPILGDGILIKCQQCYNTWILAVEYSRGSYSKALSGVGARVCMWCTGAQWSQSLWFEARVYGMEPESMVSSQSQWCQARVNVVESESMVWSQSLWCRARFYVVESELMAFSQSLLCGASDFLLYCFVECPKGTQHNVECFS